jgi:hypothetical protein
MVCAACSGNGLGSTGSDSGDFRYWTQSIDGTLYACWYRLRPDGQIEVFARGHRVILPLDAIALLPESVARAVLAQLNQSTGSSEYSGVAEPQAAFAFSALRDSTERNLAGEVTPPPREMTQPANPSAGCTGPDVATQMADASDKTSDPAP